MSRPTLEERVAMHEAGHSRELRADFDRAERAVRQWEQTHGTTGLDDILDWNDSLRRAFGEPEVDLDPWVGNEYRL